MKRRKASSSLPLIIIALAIPATLLIYAMFIAAKPYPRQETLPTAATTSPILRNHEHISWTDWRGNKRDIDIDREIE